MAALRLVNTGTAERAQVTDVPAMKQIIDYYAKQNRMLFRSLAELYGGIRDYVVWRQDGTGGRLLRVARDVERPRRGPWLGSFAGVPGPGYRTAAC